MAGLQFNLLPAVKLEYIKAQSMRNKITRIAFLISAASVALLILMLFSVEVVQKKQLSDANKDITTTTASIQSQPEITKVLTVQNQLKTLSTLHANKHVMSRLFTYLSEVTPANANLARVSLDTATASISIDGTADTAATVNKFIDTLKFTNYQVGSDSTTHPAFPSVVETSFNISTVNVSYSVTVQYDPNLFANNLKDSSGSSAEPKLQVPNQSTTRSSLDSVFGGGR